MQFKCIFITCKWKIKNKVKLTLTDWINLYYKNEHSWINKVSTSFNLPSQYYNKLV